MPGLDITAPPRVDKGPSGNQKPSDDGGSGSRGGNVYGYGGGGGGSSGPSDEQREAAANLGGIVGYNRDTILGQYDDTMATFDLADQQNRNLRDNNILLAKQDAGSDWFRQHLNLQRTASALNDRSSNAMRGSYLYDYRDLLAAADDNIDAETLDTQRQNTNQVLQSYFEAVAQNNVNRQEAAMNTEQGLRELYADYVAQINNIHPDLASGLIDSKNHTLNPTDWLSTDFFDSHKRDPMSPDRQAFYRPNQANTDAREKGLTGGNYNTESSATGSYWDRMNRGYDQRTRQA